MVKLYLYTDKKGRLVYGIGLRFRLFYLFFAFMIGIGSFTYRNDPAISLFSVPIIIMIILFIAAWYQEAWVFDSKNRCITYLYGLVFLQKRHEFSFNEIEALELTLFRKGTKSTKTRVKSRAARLFRTFSLVLKSGERYDIEILRLKQSAGRTEHAAAVISQYCGIRLSEERETEQDGRESPEN